MTISVWRRTNITELLKTDHGKSRLLKASLMNGPRQSDQRIEGWPKRLRTAVRDKRPCLTTRIDVGAEEFLERIDLNLPLRKLKFVFPVIFIGGMSLKCLCLTTTMFASHQVWDMFMITVWGSSTWGDLTNVYRWSVWRSFIFMVWFGIF